MERGSRKVLAGRVVSDKMEKRGLSRWRELPGIRFMEDRPAYQKKYKFHDETNQSHHGDLVKIMETRPLSKDKGGG